MNPANVLVVVPRLQDEGGILAEMIQGALARCDMNVRIAAGDSLGSGFADHVLIKPRWLPWFIREPLLLDKFILHQAATFGFGLLIWIAPRKRSNHTLRAFRNKISIVTICRMRDGEIPGWLMQKDTPDGGIISQWIKNIIDDDITSPFFGKEHPPEVWTKTKLATWLSPKAVLGPTDSPPPSYPPSGNTPKTINLDLRFGGEDNLCHWIYLGLGSVVAAQSSGSTISFVLLPVTPNEFQTSSLAWLGIEKGQILVPTEVSEHLKWTQISPTDGKLLLDLLRPIFLCHASPHQFPSRTYISRADASYRRVANERGVLTLLARHNFCCMVASRLTLAEQIASFRDSKTIVAPHGAALTLLFCCSPDVALFELMPGHEERTCFRDISSQFNVSYYRVSCQTKGRQSRRRREADLIAPLRSLQFFATQQIDKPSSSFGVARLTSGRA